MDEPLGRAVGNALEVREAVAALSGEGPSDLEELAVEASAHLLARAGLGLGLDAARTRAAASLTDGSALTAYERWIRAQGGDPEPAALPTAPVVQEVESPRDGYVATVRARGIAEAARRLGAGRATKDDEIDHAVGVVCRLRHGEAVARGEPLAEVHAPDREAARDAAATVLAAYELAGEPPPPRTLLLEVLEA
jgi:thymidine phosphorylase